MSGISPAEEASRQSSDLATEAIDMGNTPPPVKMVGVSNTPTSFVGELFQTYEYGILNGQVQQPACTKPIALHAVHRTHA